DTIDSRLVGDPASGRLLFFAGGGTIHELDPQTASWVDTQVTSNFPQQASAMIVPVSNYGVMMLVKTVASQTQVETLLYKHATSSAPPTDSTPPSTPAALVATGVSASQIDLKWTASTDNKAVAGYRLERCQGSVCTNFSPLASSASASFSNTGLLAN